jgi:hypothetical protein
MVFGTTGIRFEAEKAKRPASRRLAPQKVNRREFTPPDAAESLPTSLQGGAHPLAFCQSRKPAEPRPSLALGEQAVSGPSRKVPGTLKHPRSAVGPGGKHEHRICTMVRCPGRKQWSISGMTKHQADRKGRPTAFWRVTACHLARNVFAANLSRTGPYCIGPSGARSPGSPAGRPHLHLGFFGCRCP